MNDKIRIIIERQLKEILTATEVDHWTLDDRTMFELTRLLSFAMKITKLQYLMSIQPPVEKED
jgi:hypothetical protein